MHHPEALRTVNQYPFRLSFSGFTVDPGTTLLIILPASTNTQIFFNKWSWHFVSMGFAYMDSTNWGSKPVFLHSHPWVPNWGLKIMFVIWGWLNLQMRWACCRVKSYTRIFYCVGEGGLAPLTSLLFKGNCNLCSDTCEGHSQIRALSFPWESKLAWS